MGVGVGEVRLLRLRLHAHGVRDVTQRVRDALLRKREEIVRICMLWEPCLG
jgi:hypothetical protein